MSYYGSVDVVPWGNADRRSSFITINPCIGMLMGPVANYQTRKKGKNIARIIGGRQCGCDVDVAWVCGRFPRSGKFQRPTGTSPALQRSR